MTFKPRAMQAVQGRHQAVYNETANYARCEQCNRLFDPDYWIGPRRYCSDNCQRKHSNAKTRKRKARETNGS